MMRVKACGITRLKDAMLAVDAGVWGLGFIFVKSSPRYIEPQAARQIINELPRNVAKVGVFCDNTFDQVLLISEKTGVNKIQLHGEESPEFCSKIKDIELIKAISIKDSGDLQKISKYKSYVNYILLDTYSPTQKGGTGKTFDWNIAKQAKVFDIPIILAGGLTPENIATAHEEVRPYALDVASGLETAKGIKSPEKIKRLKNVIANQADNYRHS